MASKKRKLKCFSLDSVCSRLGFNVTISFSPTANAPVSMAKGRQPSKTEWPSIIRLHRYSRRFSDVQSCLLLPSLPNSSKKIFGVPRFSYRLSSFSIINEKSFDQVGFVGIIYARE